MSNPFENLVNAVVDGVAEAHNAGRHVSLDPRDRAYFDKVCDKCAHLIDPSQPDSQHVTLTCKNHPEMRWFTKNIDFIGARSIFYTGEPGTECPCPLSDLVVVRDEPTGQPSAKSST